MPWIIAYIGTIVAANLAIHTFGVVPVGFGLMAPAAVYFVGLAFFFRDGVQERYGARRTFVAIGAGAILTATFDPSLAIASGAAFMLSETADLIVYTPLRKRQLHLAVLASNAVGLVVDSVVFLTLAFGSLAFLPGQIVGKAWMTLLALLFVPLLRRTRRIAAPA